MPRKISRRRFLEDTSTAIPAAATVPMLPVSQPNTTRPAGKSKMTVTVNGTLRTADVDDHVTLAELLRDHLNLTGTKIGCDRGECGACTVLLDGRPVSSCSQLAAWVDGKSVQTVEGL